MTDRERSLSPTPRERALMSEREMMEFTLDRTDALGEAISDLAINIAHYHGEAKGGIERMSYVAIKLEERDADHEKRLRELEKKIYWVGGAAAAVGLIGGLVLNFVK